MRWHLSPQERYLPRMKKSTVRLWRPALSLLVLVAVAALGEAQTPPPAVKPPPTTAPGADPGPAPTPDQISYSFGLILAPQMHNTGITPAGAQPDALIPA